MKKIYKYLFVCKGNVGRSQMAEAHCNFLTGQVIAISAGVDDVAVRFGNHPTNEIVAVMNEEGIDVSRQVIKQISEKMLAQAEKIVVLCGKEMCPAFLLKRANVTFCEIPDPYQTSLDETREIRDQVKDFVLSLIQEEGVQYSSQCSGRVLVFCQSAIDG